MIAPSRGALGTWTLGPGSVLLLVACGSGSEEAPLHRRDAQALLDVASDGARADQDASRSRPHDARHEPTPDATPLDARLDAGGAPTTDAVAEADVESGADATLDSSIGADASSPPHCRLPTSLAEQPRLLSQTGCADVSHPTEPAASLIPFTVVSPLWSDGAEKYRFVSLPPEGKIRVKDCSRDPGTCDPGSPSFTFEDDGHFRFPVGTVLVKTFLIDEWPIETRLLMRFSESTWRGVTYEWNEAGTEATLLDGAKDREVGEQTWHYPSRSECLQCHTEAAGRALGPSVRQMNVDHGYEDGVENQIDHLRALDAFDRAPPSLSPFPDPALTDPDTLADRARAYLATNCSICHRPGGTVSDVDLRYTTSFADTDLCNRPNIRGTGDPALPDLRLVPGAPEASSLSFRMHDLGAYRMPRIGSSVVDPTGTALIDAWITSLEACP